jgi:hypothetical protein
VTTIYNVFGDKEGVIAHALREFHAGIKLNLPRNSREIAGFLRAIGHASAIVLQNRAYALALADLYFSRSLVPAIFEVIRSMPLQVFGEWRWLAEREGQLRGGVDPQSIDVAFANLEWATIKDWGCGRVADDSLIPARQNAFLLMVIANARNPVRCVAEQLLASRNNPRHKHESGHLQ